MFWRMIRGALFRQKGKMLMIAFTIALGASLSTSMLNTMLGVGDKVNRELKAYGANINVLPKEASLLDDIYGMEEKKSTVQKYLKEDELGNIKTIFWAYNIVDYTPYFNVWVDVNNEVIDTKMVGTWFDNHMDLPTGEQIDTGMIRLKNWWEVQGEWLSDSDEDSVMLGAVFATRNAFNLGDELEIKTDNMTRKLKVKGIFNSGSDEDQYIFVPLKVAQDFANKKNVVNRIEVSALTTPDNDLARKAAKNPLSLTIKEWEVWYCTAYVSAICYQIQEVMTDSVAKPIRQVAESEGDILNKTTLLMVLITVLSLIGSALGISNLVTAGVMERSAEIGLQKAVGASNGKIIGTILTEIILTGIAGGIAGYFVGLGLTQIIGYKVFGSAIAPAPMVIPIVVILILLITILGSIPSIKYLLKLNPTEVLHGR
ncbi:ABC transporter permease [Peptoniphilus sp. oral taxon 386]|uniref:ABC transporter permease n=1 Tax=Peptoniphilus sp. oral taxon 386 TaxID=652713 RepID=UPI0001DA9A8D|nr:ABC transporter permease [Peptoniphilus sp. oral taxon 386]EFI41959.1 efflux ABC transporter, permease protein [Peptoniphilus sp. oral taxon 386 str. F0131]